MMKLIAGKYRLKNIISLIFSRTFLIVKLMIRKVKNISIYITKTIKNKSFQAIMNKQVIQYAQQYKHQLKELKQSHPSMIQLQTLYKSFKKLYQMIKQFDEPKEKTPAFFQALHQTTVDMRMKLLADLGKSENLRKKAQAQHKEFVKQLKDQIDKKEKQLAKSQKNLQRQPGEIERLKNQNKNLEKQTERLGQNIKGLTQRLNKQLQMQKDYRNEIKKLREDENAKTRQNRRLSPSPDRVADNIENRTVYDNVLGSFSDIPNDKNFTQWDHTYSHHETDRKAKSVYIPNSGMRMPDQLLRFIYIQACSLEQFISQ